MKNQISEQVMKIPSNSAAYLFEKSLTRLLPDCHSDESSKIAESKINSAFERMRLGYKMVNFAQGIQEHFRLAPKFTEMVKGKLSLGTRILQVGGVEKVFKQLFSVENGEKLLKASQCYLSTTAGPIAGLLFISTDKVAFCSERSIKFLSPTGELLRIYYKVSIPLANIKQANTSNDKKKTSQKYIEVVTDDNFEFWFMGFLNGQKTLKCLQQVLHEAS